MTINTIYYEIHYKEYAFTPPPPYIASLQAIALICCFVVLFFSCEEETPKSSDKKIDQLVLTVGGTDMPVTFDADYNAALTVPFGTDLTATTVKTLLVSDKATVSVAQGDVLTITGGSATLTVTAEDGSKQVYTVGFTATPPRTGTDITALTVTIAGAAYSTVDNNSLVTITDNTIVIMIPFGIGVTALPTRLSLTGLTLSAGASSVPAEGATLDLSGTGVGMISVQAEDPSVMVSYTVSATILGQPVVTTYTGTDTLGIAVRDVVEAGRSVSFAAMDTVIAVSGLADVSFDWALGTLTGTKTAMAGSLILTQSDLAMFPATADATYALTVSANGQTSEGKDLFYYPGQVRTWRDLQGVRVDLTGTYRMMRNIAFPDEDGDGVSEYNFEPLGRDTNKSNDDVHDGASFSGNFNGNGYAISRLYINRADEDFVGLFGLNNRSIINVALITYNIIGRKNVGGVAGENDGTMTGYASGNVNGEIYIGGLVGYNNNGTVRGYATGNVSGSTNVGGLLGLSRLSRSGTITGYSLGNITGDNNVGGLVGGALSDNGSIIGYFRGLVKRNNNQSATSFGLLMGKGTAAGFHSGAAEEGNFEGITTNNAAAADGTTITVSGTTTQANFEPAFTFGNAAEQWQWIAGRWPAIYLETKPATEQPTQP